MSEQDSHIELKERGEISYAQKQITGKPTPSGDYYRVSCVVERTSRPNLKNEYFVPVFRLSEFFEDHPSGDVTEEIVDVEPLSESEKDAILTDYRQNDSKQN